MQFDAPKMPFYMSYPMQNLYLTEMEYEKDMERMKELYPREVKRILEFVEDECDKMEYEGITDCLYSSSGHKCQYSWKTLFHRPIKQETYTECNDRNRKVADQ